VLLDKGLLLIHPRCAKLKAAFQNYVRKQAPRGDWLDEPADPQHPYEDLIDALHGGIRDRFPEGRRRAMPRRGVPTGRISLKLEGSDSRVFRFPKVFSLISPMS
jgi:hypothetical protein